MLGILTEKPSAARNFAKALGGMNGTFEGEEYRIVTARGHLYEFADPDKQVAAELVSKYRNWYLKDLPWNEADIAWKRVKAKGADPVLKEIKAGLKGCEEVVIATDDDPTGEGELLAWEILEGLKIKARWSRMYFVDESVKSIQKAFRERKAIASMAVDTDYQKAYYRTRWDYLSMQFTRIAAANAPGRAILRQGRLKSAMIVIVGDQLKLVKAYQKIPFYQNRFRDENGVIYTDKKESQYPRPEDVPQVYEPSPAVLESRQRKHSIPPRLLDMAGLASELAGRGIRAKQVQSTYQKMYEDQVVSYPRTADKNITFEQFYELAPLVDRIAHLVGVDTALLTHREPRPSHVKNQGSHGANRPGTNVPASLESLEKYGPGAKQIYTILAKNYLAMLAPDYEYDLEKGYLEKYPTFKGEAKVPRVMGWKAVFKNADAEDEANSEEGGNGKGLGTIAEPFVYEGFPPKPVEPTMKWLMKQLEKRDVGTGATRTSIYADVTNQRAKYPLMLEKRGKLSLTQYGEQSYALLPGTNIGDLTITEQLMADMRGIEQGSTDPEQRLAGVKDMVVHDIDVMRQNADNLRIHFTRDGQDLSFKRMWGEHYFTDEEVAKLLAGETVSFKTSKGEASGVLAEQEYKGKTYWGFKPDEKTMSSGKGAVRGAGSADGSGSDSATPDRITGMYRGKEVSFKSSWGGHTFTEEEIAALLADEPITFDYTTKRGRKRTATGKLGYGTGRFKKIFGFQPEDF